MKPRRQFAFLTTFVCALSAPFAQAAVVNKAATGTNLAAAASWSAAPTSADDATWISTSLAGAQTVDSVVTWNSMNFAAAGVAADVSITGSAISLASTPATSGDLVINSSGKNISIAADLILTGGYGVSPTVGQAGTNRMQINAASGTLTLGNVTASGSATAADINLILRGAGTGTVNGTLTVDGQLGKGDAGTWTLNGSNSIGWVFSNNGTLLAGNNAAFGTGTIYLGSGGGNMTLASANSTARSFTNALDFSPASGAFTGVANFGQTTGGTGDLTFSGNVNLGTAVRGIATNANTTLSGIASGAAGGITKTGTGSLTLTAANTYTGATTVSAGTLNLNKGGGAGTIIGSLTIASGATANVNVTDGLGNAQNTRVTSIAINGGTLNLANTGNNSGTSIGISFTGGTFTGIASSKFDLRNNGIGDTNITTNAAATTATISVPTLGTGGGSTTITTAKGTAPSGVDLLISSNIVDNAGAGGAGGGTHNLTKAGVGTLLLSGTNTFTGATSVNGGTLVLDYTTNNTNKVATTNPVTLGGGGALQFNANTGAATSQTINGLTLSGPGAIALSTAAGQTLTADFTGTGTGVMTGLVNGLNVVTTGTGTAQLKLPGTTANTAFLPSVTFNSTRFARTDANNFVQAVSTANNTASDLSTWVTGATVYGTTGSAFTNSVGSGVVIDGIGFNDAAARTVTIGGGNTLTLNQGIIVSGAVGNNASIITGGSIRAASGGTLTILNNDLSNNLTIASIIADNGGSGLVKVGSGTLVLSGANTYTGITTINAGTLSLGTIKNVGTASPLGAPTTVANGTIAMGTAAVAGTLLYTGTGDATDRAVDLAGLTGGAVIDQSGTGLLKFTSAFTATGLGSKTLTLQGSTAGTGEIAGAIVDNSVTNTTSVTKAGTGTWTLSGNNTYTGGTNVNAGTLVAAGSVGALSLSTVNLGAATLSVKTDDFGTISQGNTVTLSGSVTATINVGNNGGATTGSTVAFGALNNGTAANALASTINFTGSNGYLQSFSSLGLPGSTGQTTTLNPTTTSVTITGNVTNRLTTPLAGHFDTLALAGTSSGNTINGVISDATSGAVTVGNGDTRVTKSNTSTWTLAGANSYTGPTVINGGVLSVTGSLAAGSAVAVNSGGALSGTGTVGGAVTVASGGAVNLLDGATNNLTLASTLTLAANSNLYFDLGTFTTDMLTTGAITGGANAIINLHQLAGTPINPGVYTLVSGASGSTAGATLATTRAGGYLFSLDTSFPGQINLNVSTSVAGPATTYWSGATDAVWGTAGNWNTDATSNLGTGAAPGLGTNVTFATTTPVAGNLTTTLGADFEINSLTFSSGIGATTIAGANMLVVDAANGITSNNTSGTNTISAKVGMGSNQTWTVAGGGTLAISGAISDLTAGYSLTKAGSGMLTLTGANIYAGGTTVSAGTLQLGDGTTNPTINSTYSIASGAMLRLLYNTGGGAAPTWSKYTGAGTLALGSGKTFDTSWGTAALGATFTGTLQVERGRVITDPAAGGGLGGTTSVVVTNGGHLGMWQGGTFNQNFTLAGVGYGENGGYNGALRLGNPGITTTLNGSVTLAGNTTLVLSTGGFGVINGNIGESTIGSGLTIGDASNVAGTVTLNGTNSYTGPTTVNFGTLVLPKRAALYGGNTGSWTTANVTVGSGANAIFNVGGVNEFTSADIDLLKGLSNVGAATATQGFKNGSNIGFDTTNATGGNFTYATAITNHVGTVTDTLGIIKVGTGTLALTGVNTYTGSTQINGGTVRINAVSGLGAGTGSAGYLGIANNSTLQYDGAGVEAVTGRYIWADTGTTWTVNVTQPTGALTLTPTGGNRTLNLVKNGTGTMVMDGALSGAASVTVNGGTLALKQANTYTGNTLVSQGILDLTGGGGVNGTIRGTATISPGATLRLSTGDATGYDGTTRLSVINLVGSTLNVNTTANQTLGSAAINMTGASITGIAGANLDFFAGASTLNSFASSSTSTISGTQLSPLRQGSTTFTVAPGTTTSGIDLDVQSVIKGTDANTAVFTITGGGTVAFSGTNTITGSATRSIAITGTGTTLMVGNGGTTGTLGTMNVTNNSTLTFNRSDAAGSFSNIISGTGQVKQSGTGTTTLTGVNTYTGATNVTGGALIVTGSTVAASAVNVATGTTLGGTGTVAGTVTAAGTIAPGTTGTGTLNTGAVTLTGTYACQLDGANSDKLVSSGTLTLTGATLAISTITTPTAPSYVIATFTGATPTFTTVTGIPSGYGLDTSTAGQIKLSNSPFIVWAGTNGLTAANNGPLQDPDHDGLTNLLEFVLGGNPLTSSQVEAPVQGLDPSMLHFYFLRSTQSKQDTNVTVQWGTNLGTWNDIVIPDADLGDGVVQINTSNPAFDNITVNIPRSNAVNGKLFVRLKATPKP